MASSLARLKNRASSKSEKLANMRLRLSAADTRTGSVETVVGGRGR